MKLRGLMGWVLGRATDVAGIARGAGASGFELLLTPSREDPGHYAIGSVGLIDRRAAHEVLRDFELVGTSSFVPYRSIVGRGEQDEGGVGTAGPQPRITLVRLTPRQAWRIFARIRRREPDVRKLYAHLGTRNLEQIRDEARGSVMRAYAANGVARGEGVVVELLHRRADGTEASLHVSIKDWMADEGGSGEVKAEYEIRHGEQIEIYEIEDGRVCLVEA
jgi:hypothetical protein